jgi:hypothetical protein
MTVASTGDDWCSFSLAIHLNVMDLPAAKLIDGLHHVVMPPDMHVYLPIEVDSYEIQFRWFKEDHTTSSLDVEQMDGMAIEELLDYRKPLLRYLGQYCSVPH